MKKMIVAFLAVCGMVSCMGTQKNSGATDDDTKLTDSLVLEKTDQAPTWNARHAAHASHRSHFSHYSSK